MERCLEWAIYSDNMDFMSLSPTKILNKVICDFHFKENNFMNYKRERLTKTNAVPTIYVSPENNAEVDLATTPTHWVTANKAKAPTTSLQPVNAINIDESSVNNSMDEVIKSPPKKLKMIQTLPSSTSAVRILNVSANSGSEVSFHKVAKKLPVVSRIVLPSTSPNVIKVDKERFTIRKVPIQKVPSSPLAPKIIKQEILRSQDSISLESVESTLSMIEEAPIVLATVDKPDTQANMNPQSMQEDLKPILLDSLKQIAEMKEMLNDSKKLKVEPPTPKVSDESSPISHSQFNKVQLFNGIKRYLSPSMNALLRIELFSTPGREYKKDEKIICQELLQLGEKTYDFFNDEWRLRLPAKKDVQTWVDQKIAEEDDDAS